MSSFTILGTAVGLITFIPLFIGIYTKKIKQNLMTWTLWAMLDGIAGISTLLKDGNWLLPTAYSIGAALAAVMIYKVGSPVIWTWFETMVLGFVIACLVVWGISGPRYAIIASSLAVCGAGVPQLIDAIKKPGENSILVYLGYTTANALNILGGKEWSIEERCYPTFCTAYTLLVLLATARKFSKPNTLQVG